MSCTPTELFEHAKDIAASAATEAARRAAISRLYYSAHHACNEFHSKLPSPGSVGNAAGSHEQLIAMLDNPTIPRGDAFWASKGLSKSLRLVLSHRVSADYITDENVTAEMVKESLTQSEVILKKCSTAALAKSSDEGSPPSQSAHSEKSST